jgi:hypothetical protein
MIQTCVAQDIVNRTDGSSLEVAGAEHNARDPGMDNGSRAHHAGFQRAIKRGSGQAIVGQVIRRIAHRHDLGMARRIVCGDRPVRAAADNLAFLRDDDRADRNLSGLSRLAGLSQRLFHEMIVHCRMLNYSAMKPLRSLILACLLPCGAFAQGVRMPADFLPLDVGTRWTYDLITENGQKAGQMNFAVEEYTIVAGTSFYVLTEFPFSEEKDAAGEPIRYIRYDRAERQFMRKRGADEGPLFLESGSSTEVLEADPAGSPLKFLLKTDSMTLTFQRGIGIVEAKLKSPAGIVTAKMVNVQGKSLTNSVRVAAPGPTPPSGRVTERDIVPPPVPVPSRRESPTATVTSKNPQVDVLASAQPGRHEILMVVANVDDRLLPFRFGSSQTYDFVITDAATGREVWRWSKGQFFTQVVRTDSIRPKSKWQFEVVWNHLDNDGNPVVPGQYRLNAIVTSLPQVSAAPQILDVR